MASADDIDIERIDKNMSLYYKELGAEYAIDEETGGLFQSFCDDNGFDADTILDEFQKDAQDLESDGVDVCDPVDGFADGNFPFPKTKPQTAATIIAIVRECNKENPNFGIYTGALPECMYFK